MIRYEVYEAIGDDAVGEHLGYVDAENEAEAQAKAEQKHPGQHVIVCEDPEPFEESV